MADTIFLSSTPTQIEIEIENLSQAANTYTQFHVDIFYNGSQIGTESWTDGNTGNYTTHWVSTGLNSGNTYTFNTYANPGDGNNYSSGSCTGSTQHLTTPVGEVTANITSSGAMAEWNPVNGADHYDVYLSTGQTFSLVYGTSYSFSGLAPSTQYYWQVRAANKPTAQTGQADDITAYSSATYFNTQSNNVPPSQPSSAPVLNSRTDTTLSLSWGSSTGATSYTVHMVNQTDNSVGDQGGFSSTSGTVVGLQAGTSYSVSVAGQNSYGTSPYTASNIASTNPKTPTCQFVSKTSTTQTIQENNVSGNWTGFIFNQYDQNGTFITSINTSAQTVTFNVNAGQTYEYDIQTYWNVNGTTLYSNLSNRITVGGRPNNWQWSSPVPVDGNGHITSGSNYQMPASQWNSFQNSINSFQQYKNVTSTAFTSVSSGNQFTAAIFNTAQSAIADMSPPTSPPATQSSGNEIYASLLNGLMDSLNSIT